MAEVLFRVVDKPRTGDSLVDSQRTMAGDEIATCPDGHPWSERERTNPEWRIVKVADLPVPQDINDPIAELCYHEESLARRDEKKSHKKFKESKTWQPRGKKVNLPDVARSRIGVDMEMSAGDLLLATETKPKVKEK